MKRWNELLLLISLAAGILVAITPFYLVPVCTKLLELSSGMFVHMTCHWTGKTEVLLGVLVVTISAAALVTGRLSGENSKFTGLVLIALGVGGLLIPTDLIIGICKNPEMDCRSTVKVLNWLLGVVVLTGLLIFSSVKDKGEKGQNSVR